MFFCRQDASAGLVAAAMISIVPGMIHKHVHIYFADFSATGHFFLTFTETIYLKNSSISFLCKP